MKTYENNMADQALVVKSLKVLDKVEGGAFKEIRQSVESVRKQTNVISRQQDEYWKTLSDDGIITPIEKQSLLRESHNIDRSFAAITQQAATLGIASAILEDYIATYNALRTYLFTTLKLFDDMQSETNIDDRDTFNAYFSGYYFSENFVLLAITAGILDTIDFRVLQSLTEPGEEGETAIYHGALYQYVNGQWKNVTTGAYKGPRTELPPDEEEAFFIVSESFTMSESLIVNDEELLVNGDTLLVTHTYLKGYIYYFQAGTWHPEWDKTNWRYAAAFADVLNITGELPQIFQDGLDAIQANLDAAVLTLEDEIAAKQGQYTIIGGEMVLIDDLLPQIIEEYNEQQSQIDDQQTEIDSKINHLPVYYGGTSVAPGSPQEGDFYLFTGSGENNCKVRRYHNAAWEWLDPTNTNYRNYYMMALQDILSNSGAGTATFSNAFAQNFWAACANMETLDVKTIYLRNDGKIQSAELTYVPESVGTRIDADGDIDANGNTHIKGKCAIGVPLTGNTDFNDFDVVIGGKTAFKSSMINDGLSVIIQNSIFSKKMRIYENSNTTLIQLACCLIDYVGEDPVCEYAGSKNIDVTLPNDQYLYLQIPNINFAKYIQRVKVQFQLSDHSRSVITETPYCYITVYERNTGTSHEIISLYDYFDWELNNIGSTKVELYLYKTNISKIKYGELIEYEPEEKGIVYKENGFLKVAGMRQPWHYKRYDSQTDKRYVYDDISAIFKNIDNTFVSCIGHFGLSDSSNNRSLSGISFVNRNLIFYNFNGSQCLSIPNNTRYGTGNIERDLEVLFIISN